MNAVESIAVADERAQDIREYLRACTTNGLRRVINAEKWCRACVIDHEGAKCLVGHAENYFRINGTVQRRGRVGAFMPPFDALAFEHGLAPVVAFCQSEAAAILAEREAAR